MANQVATATVLIMPSLDGAQKSITSMITEEASTAGDKGGKTLGDKLSTGLSGGLSKAKVALGALAVALPVAAIGKGLLDIGAQFDEMTDNIIIGTGASGDALADMEDQAKRVATTMPTTFGDAGQRVADLNTRLGLTGDALGDLAIKFEGLEAIGNGLDTMLATGTLTAFNVAVEDMGAKLDYAWGVSQATGIGMTDLFNTLQSNAPALTSLGFSFEEAANMAGLLDKAGIDASGTMSKLSKGLMEIAEPGADLKQVFFEIVQEIENYVAAGDTAAALNRAGEIFGTKGATQFVAAIESGAMSLDQLSDAALGASGDIEGTFNATADWPERWEIIKNKVSEALAPLGGALMDALTTASEKITELMEGVDPQIFEDLGEALGQIATDAIQLFADICQWFVDNREPIGEFFSALGDFFSSAAGLIGDVVQALTDFYNWMKDIEADFGAWCDEVGPQIEGAFESVGQFFTDIGTGIDEFVTGVGETWDSFKQGTSDAFNAVKGSISESMEAAKLAGSEASSALTAALNGDWDNAQQHAAAAWGAIASNTNSKISSIQSTVVPIVDDIGNRLGFPGLGDKVNSVFEGIKSFIQNPIETAANFIKSQLDRITGFFSGLHLELPQIKLPHFSIQGTLSLNPPSVPHLSIDWYKQGGYFDGAQIIGIGEAGPEAALPLTSPFMDPFADAVSERMSENGGGGVTVVVQGDVSNLSRVMRDARLAKRYGNLAGDYR